MSVSQWRFWDLCVSDNSIVIRTDDDNSANGPSKAMTNTWGATRWPKWRHLVVKFLINTNGKIGINASGTTRWLNLQLSDSNNTGLLFPLAMFGFLSRVDSRELPECEEAFSCSPNIYKSVSLLTISLVHSVPCADLCSRIHWAEMLLVCQNLKVAHLLNSIIISHTTPEEPLCKYLRYLYGKLFLGPIELCFFPSIGHVNPDIHQNINTLSSYLDNYHPKASRESEN